MSIRFGVSPIAWINDDMPELGADTSLEHVLAEARDIGFAGIELGGRFPRDAATLATLLARFQLVLVGGLSLIHILKAAGGRVVFDIDYRPVLWGLAARDLGENRFVAHAAVTQRLQNVLPLCDLVVGTEEEIRILGGVEDTLAALKNIRAQLSLIHI